MMKNKKKRKNLFILGIILAIAFLIIIWQLGGFDSFLSAEIIPLGTFTQNSPFVCTNASYCNVQGTLYCDTKHTGNAIVTFRTNAYQSSEYDNDGTWFAINGVPSGSSLIKTSSLSGYCRTSSFSSCVGSIVGYTKTNDKIYAYNSEFRVETSGHCRRYSSTCPSSVLDTNQVAGYETREITEGESSSYSCSGFFTIEDLNQNSLINPVSLSCSSNTNPCSQNYVYPLGVPEDSVVSVTGGDRNEITYQRVIVPECSKNTCDEQKLGYTECNNGQWGDYVPCDTLLGYVCSNGECKPPFDLVEITTDKTGYQLGENVKVYVKIVSGFSNLNVNVKIKEGSPTGTTKKELSQSLTSGSTKTYTFSGLELGTYYITLDIDAGLSEHLTYGEEFAEQKSFRIGAPLELNIPLPYSPDTGTALYTNSPIYIDLIASDSSGRTTITNYSLTVKYNGIVVQNPNYLSPLPEDGLYRFIYQFANAGTLEISGQVEKSGVKSNVKTYTVEVKNPLIVTLLTNIKLIRIIPPSERTITFETKNSFGELIDTNNIVKIIPPGAVTGSGDIDVSDTVIWKETGKYEFTYNLDKTGGYSVEIESSATGYPIGDVTGSGTITVQPGVVPDECASSLDCPAGKICISGKCVEKDQPILLYVIIGASVLFIIVLIVLIINLSKKKKAPELGGY